MKVKLIACQTIWEEIDSIPYGMEGKFMEFGLHLNPKRLNKILQDEIYKSLGFDAILLGYGLCGGGIAGLYSPYSKIVVPKAHDCIAIFLGSCEEYRRQFFREPGTFYLTKGWIECGDDPLSYYLRLKERVGEKKAFSIAKGFIKNYTRLALITSGNDFYKYEDYAKRVAETFSLRFEKLEGSNLIVDKLINGPWDKDFIVVEPNEGIRYEVFWEE